MSAPTDPRPATRESGHSPLPAVGGATAIAAGMLGLIWLYVVPRPIACPAIYPAPPSCSSELRHAAAVSSSMAIVAAYLLAFALLLTVGRSRRGLRHAALILLTVIAFVGLGAVQAGGFAVP